MALYKLTKDGVSIPSKNMFIPNNQDNRDWQKYQDWLLQGNTPDPADIPNPMIAVRAERDRLMSIADIEINKLDDNAGDSTPTRIYRQSLRNVPQNQPDATIDTVIWPVV